MPLSKKVIGFLFIALITLLNYSTCSSHSLSSNNLPYATPRQRFCALPIISILIAGFIIMLFY